MESTSIHSPCPNTAHESVLLLVNGCSSLSEIYAQGLEKDMAIPCPEECQCLLSFMSWRFLVGAAADQPPDQLDKRLQRTGLKDSVVSKLQELRECLLFGIDTRTKHGFKSYKENKTDWKHGYERIRAALDGLYSLAFTIGGAHESKDLEAVQRLRMKLDPSDKGLKYIQSCYPSAKPTLQRQLQNAVMHRRLQTFRRQELASHESGSSHDLHSLVCISEQCGLLPPSFATTAEWKLHMAVKHGAEWPQLIHQTEWFCPYCDELAPYMNQGYLLHHLMDPAMSLRHGDRRCDHLHAIHGPEWFREVPRHIPEARFAAFSKICNRTVPLEAGFCPLCGPSPWTKLGEGDEGDDMEEHLASHIRAIFSNFPC